MFTTRAAAIVVCLMMSALHVLAFQATPPSNTPAAVAAPAIPAILEAFKTHSLVAIGDMHGNQQGLEFQLALIRTPAFLERVDDVLVELGNSRYQDVIDRYVRGENVPDEQLVKVWRDTTQQQAAPWQMPAVIRAVRDANQNAKSNRRLRLLLGEPPLDWATIKTADDLQAAEASSGGRDRFAAQLIRRGVLAQKRRVLALYGAGHFFRRNETHSLITLLEEAGDTRAFTVWTNAAADMATMQSDVSQWPVSSLAVVKGTVLGRTPFETYFGRFAADMAAQWKVPMEEQFDAVLYLGPLSAIKMTPPERWPCAEPAFSERLRRVALIRTAIAERLKQTCTQ